MFQNPTGYKAGRRFVHLGVTYNIDDAVPVAVVANMKKSDQMLSRRYIIPDTDPHGRKTDPATPQPTSMPAKVRQNILDVGPAQHAVMAAAVQQKAPAPAPDAKKATTRKTAPKKAE